MIDWIGAGGLYHAVVNGQAACGVRIGGSTLADHPCEVCAGMVMAMATHVPGLDAVDE